MIFSILVLKKPLSAFMKYKYDLFHNNFQICLTWVKPSLIMNPCKACAQAFGTSEDVLASDISRGYGIVTEPRTERFLKAQAKQLNIFSRVFILG